MKSFIKRITRLQYIWRKLLWFRTKFYLTYHPHVIPNNAVRSVFRRDIDWQNPKNLIDKIYWLQLYTDTSLWTKCADKYLVREYVEEKGCGEILNTLYGKWDNANDIDWVALPNSFVLKANNSCGDVILVKDKDKLNIPETIKKLNSWLNTKYGYYNAQLHYTHIKPCIIAEKLFENKKNPEHSLVDYKIWCFHGKPECVLIVYNRTKNSYLLSQYDLEWNNISGTSFNKNNSHFSGEDIPKPSSFDKMIEYAKILSKDFTEVRVDFYNIDNKPVFGEMTFTTGYGYYSDEYYEYLGTKIDLSKVEKLDNPNKPFKSIFN